MRMHNGISNYGMTSCGHTHKTIGGLVKCAKGIFLRIESWTVQVIPKYEDVRGAYYSLESGHPELFTEYNKAIWQWLNPSKETK